MKLKLLIIGLALLVSAVPSHAGGIMMMGGGVAVAVSCSVSNDSMLTGYNTTADSTSVATISSTAQRSRQSLTLSSGATLTGFRMYIYDDWGGSDNITYALYDSDMNAVSGATASLSATNIGAVAWYDFFFSSPVTVSSGTYYIVGSIASSNIHIKFNYRVNSTDGFAGGDLTWSENSGGSWSSLGSNGDQFFEVWGCQ